MWIPTIPVWIIFISQNNRWQVYVNYSRERYPKYASEESSQKNESENSPEFTYKVRGPPFASKIVKLPHKEAKKVSEGSHCSKTKIGPNHSLHRNLDNTTSLTLNCMLVNAKGRKDEKVDK